jgi:hypothetical protein
MADAADIASEIVADTVTAAVFQARASMRQGAPGECEQCEWPMPRLVDGLCAFCRDGRARPDDWEPTTLPADSAASSSDRERIVVPESKNITFAASGSVLDELKRVVATGQSYNKAVPEMIHELLDRRAKDVSAPSAPAAVLDGTLRQRMYAALDAAAQVAAELLDRPDDSAALAALEQRAQAAEAERDTLQARFDAVRAAIAA